MRLLLIELHALAINVGYWVRPYDMLADARRWRWQPRRRCGRQVWAEMTPQARDVLNAAIARRHNGGDL